MKQKFAVLIVVAQWLVASASSPADAQTLAFPGAEGFGAKTPGGRGGTIIRVTNLNSSGAGSLRYACTRAFPRIVVFDVGGTITLDKDIRIDEPFITIAGQTAPGDGIMIRGASIRIAANDVVIRGLRVRVGDLPGPDPKNRDGFTVENSDNIIIDHCSVTWGLDENIATWSTSDNITIQWCLIAENILTDQGAGFPNQSYGILIGDHGKHISVHHNLMAHHNERHPRINNDTITEVVNNVVYNWKNAGTDISGDTFVNVIKNYYKPGPNTAADKKGIRLRNESNTEIYVKGNVGPGRLTDSGDEWNAVDGDQQYQTLSPATSPSGITEQAAVEAFDLVLDNVGALAPVRDTVDARIVQSVREGTGKIIGSQDEVGGWPTFASGTPPVDSDGDGMPDAWETDHNLDPNDAGDGHQDQDGDGYTNVEEYLNSLIPMPGLADATPPAPPHNLKVN